MSVITSTQVRTPWIATLLAILLLWTLYTMDLSRVNSVAYSVYEETVESTIQPTDMGAVEEAEVANTNGQPSSSSPMQTPTTSSPETSASFSVQDSPTESSQENLQSTQPVSDRPLILYAYSETESARFNIEFFIRHALHGAADFVFILNGETDVASLIPDEPNIRYVQRENDCYDIGAYADVLTRDDFYKNYKRFIMLNASIRGPFVPYWSGGCWSDMYLGKVTDEVKLVGMTSNCWPSFHIQSMIWATDIIGMETLLFPSPAAVEAYNMNPPKSTEKNETQRHLDSLEAPRNPGINSCFHTWKSAVTAEVGASTLIKAAGYKLDVMMSAFHSSEKYEEECNPETTADLLWNEKYYGTNVHPFETVFMKSNRDVDPTGLDRHTEWVDGRGYSSYDFCKAL